MINIQKSYTVYIKKTPRKFIRLLNKGLKIDNRDKLGKYLGCPIDVNGHSLNLFQELPEKVVQTISSWKFSALNQACKLILIHSTLIAYASQSMYTFLFPKNITKRTLSVIRKLWWSALINKKPIYWRKITLLKEHKSNGGLGLRNIEILNKETLCKQAS